MSDLRDKAVLVKRCYSQHPFYSTNLARVMTFDEQWTRPQKAEDMAAAGFFYTGEDDIVTCFHCGNSLHQWRDDDEPIKEHTIYFAHVCDFVKAIQSKQNIHDTFFEQAKKQEEEKEEENEALRCKICLFRRVVFTMVPCGHLCTCATCVPQIDKCPICRKVVSTIVRTFV